MTETRITRQPQLWEEESYQIGCAFAREEALERLSALEQELFGNKPLGWRVEGWKERTMMTHFGEVRVRRRLYRDNCGRYRFLLDEHLGWEPYQSATPAMSESVASLASHMPFREVEAIISRLSAGVLSAKSIHTLVQKLGAKAIAEEEDQWRSCFERGEEMGEGKEGVEVLYTEADGVWVHLQQETQEHYEVKSAIAYEGWEKQRQDRYSLLRKRVYCHANPRIAFWESVSVEWSKVYDLSKVRTVVIGGDGANWIASGTGEFSNSVMQLDGFHLARACGRGFGKQQGHHIYEAVREGREEDARRLIDEAEPVESSGAKKARKYVKANVAKGLDWRNQVEKVPDGARGLGTMESNGDKLIANRMKKRGLSWTKKGAMRMAKVIQLRANRELGAICHRSEPREPPVSKRRSRKSPVSPKNGRQPDRPWLQATVPSLIGPHHSRPWVKSLRSLVQPHRRLN